jgi:DNA primase
VPGSIPEEVIAEVRERTDIVQVIGQHVQLKRSGINYKGLCPFHDEKTPSFNVNSAKQFFHCFGCHESGDVFKFLMKIEGRRFGEVVEDLAARAGVEIPRQHVSPAEERAAAQRRSERQQGLDLNRAVADLYRALLLGDQGAPARDYLKQRGVSEKSSETFCLGYAPPRESPVARFLERKGVPMSLAERLGLVARRRDPGLGLVARRRDPDTGGGGKPGYHDRFWNRLIFPVIGASGEVLGFGGRLLGDGDGPKYINTPETALYKKGEVLYGLHAAASAMRKGGQALIVEGNLDVIQLHQHGFEHAVAPMGTALTPRQVSLLRRFAHKVVALFDGDDAGNAAALKAVTPLVESGLEAKIASLPRGHDPDSFLRDRSAEELTRVLATALPVVTHLIETRRKQMEDTLPGRARLLEEVAPLLARLPSPVDRDLTISALAQDLKIEEGVIRRAVAGNKPTLQALRPREVAKVAQHLPPAELYLLGVLFAHPHLFPRAEAGGASSLLTNDGLRATYRAAMQMQQASGRIDPSQLLQSIPEGVKNPIAESFQAEAFASEDPTRALDDCLSALQRASFQRQLQDIRNQMAQARAAGDPNAVRDLAVRQVELERKIHETR